MKQRKEEMVEECLEAYFHLTVKGEKCCLFQDKNGNLYKPHHKENGMYVFLQESPKTDIITYVKELHRFCTKIVKYAMKTKELKITIPAGHEINWQESAKQKKIVFKKVDNKPRSWEEYCSTAKKEVRFCIEGVPYILGYGDVNCEQFKKYFKNEKIASAFGAMMKLMNLREEWIHQWSVEQNLTEDWKPDWENNKQYKANIFWINDKFFIAHYSDLASRPLSFPTKEMAKDFLECFKDLINTAKPLL